MLTICAYNAYNIHMPIVLILNSIKFYIYFEDHGLPHVHAIKDKNQAKITIYNPKCIAVRGFSKKDIKMLVEFVKENQEMFLEKWEEFNE
jgi:hypothetical protein